MRYFLFALILSIVALTSCGPGYKDPGPLTIKNYKIGDKVDTTMFRKYENKNLYFPNYLDGWTMENVSGLPDKYQGLPIAIWISKNDSSVALTLLDDTVLKITLSYLKGEELESITADLVDKFEGDGEITSYEESHPLQAWVTYWNLKTWEADNVIVQIGNSDMRMPGSPAPLDLLWNLVYSDLKLEQEIISNYKQ